MTRVDLGFGGVVRALIAGIALTGCSDDDPSGRTRSSVSIGIESIAALDLDPSTFADVIGGGSAEVELSVFDLGALDVRSGRLVVCDAFAPDGDPLDVEIAPGRYPMRVAVARRNDDERIAFARLCIGDGPVTRWEEATPHDIDSGTGAFIDVDVAGALSKALRSDAAIASRIMDGLKESYRPTRDWCAMTTPKGNAIVFSAGYGDGRYRSYLGYDDAGALAAIVTDFDVIDFDP